MGAETGVHQALKMVFNSSAASQFPLRSSHGRQNQGQTLPASPRQDAQGQGLSEWQEWVLGVAAML